MYLIFSKTSESDKVVISIFFLVDTIGCQCFYSKSIGNVSFFQNAFK